MQDGGYRQLQAQQGIDQAFLTLNFPEALGDLGTLTWNIGTFQNRYGTMGKYDGGMYETYIFGRTHITGETLTANLTNLDNAGNWQLTLEHGVGAKYDIIPFTNNQTTRSHNVPPGSDRASPTSRIRTPTISPTRARCPQGSTFVTTRTRVAKYQKTVDVRPPLPLHLDARRQLAPDQLAPAERRATSCRAPRPDPGQHRRSSAPRCGSPAARSANGYVGYSHIDARNINALADSLEIDPLAGAATTSSRTSSAGRTTPTPASIKGPQNETGTVDNIALQYSFSFGALARYPEDWWGDGPDLVLTGVRPAVDRRQPGAADRRLWRCGLRHSREPGARRAPGT